jgi:hypothetical protein
LIKERRGPIFEAGISPTDLYSRIDILVPVGNESWDIIEVKSTTEVKAVHLDDLAFQRYCCLQAGLDIRNCNLAHLNREYVLDGSVNPEELFTIEDVTGEIAPYSALVPDRIADIFRVLDSPQCPDGVIGPHCHDPYNCSLSECECWRGVPDGSVLELYYGGTKKWQLFNQGIVNLTDIPEETKLTPTQQLQKHCALTGQCYLERGPLNGFLNSLQYPVQFLDFETVSPGIPMFQGTRPYQHVPFQFSLHVIESKNSKPVHHSFLADGRDDPRPEFVKQLKSVLKSDGSIVVYNQSFEQRILTDLAIAFPEEQSWITETIMRMKDLLQPFRKFHYYNPSQKGSASIKKVLPALTGQGYEHMEIGEGTMASLMFQTVTYRDVAEDERSRVRQLLLDYCHKDTQAMIDIIEKLKEVAT